MSTRYTHLSILKEEKIDPAQERDISSSNLLFIAKIFSCNSNFPFGVCGTI
jgi:hypothetical protein